MPKNIALVIGITQYEYLPNLAYAQKDAVLMGKFLEEQAGFNRENGGAVCLCTSSSSLYRGYSTKPNRTPLRVILKECFNHQFLSSEDSFWFFFSGHGIRYNDKDYLMPADGYPKEPEETAIELNYVTERLTRSGAGHVVMILDACRSEGQKSSQTDFGRDMPKGVTTIFSCKPKEPSYEIGEPICQSAFTYVLMESFRQQTVSTALTVLQLEQHLQTEVPRLNQQYNKPTQRPHIRCDSAANGNKVLLPHLRMPMTVEQIKANAYQAEALGNWERAKQLWQTVLRRSAPNTPDYQDAETGWERVFLNSRLGRTDPLPPPEPSPSPPNVNRKNLQQCDSSKLLFIKNVRDPSGEWAYTLNRIQEIGAVIESRVFELFWLSSSKGARSASKGDLMVLNQRAKVTHVVEMLDDEVRETSAGSFRWVRIVWMPEQEDWSLLPHQREILGFEPPTIGGGATYSFASPNFGKFHAAWNSLEAFQQTVFQRLMGTEPPVAESTDEDDLSSKIEMGHTPKGNSQQLEELLDDEKRILNRIYDLWQFQSENRFDDISIAKDLNLERNEVTDYLEYFVDEKIFKLEISTFDGYVVRLTPKGKKTLSKLFESKASDVEDDLSSDKGMDYTHLRDLLKAQDWQAADLETAHRMSEVVGLSGDDWIREEKLLNFPCKDLLTIDRLWVKYSGGKFGFSVQKQIYIDCGAKLDGKYPGDKIWDEFCYTVGWRAKVKYIYYSAVKFSMEAPQGHLPAFLLGGRWGWMGSFDIRLISLLSHRDL